MVAFSAWPHTVLGSADTLSDACAAKQDSLAHSVSAGRQALPGQAPPRTSRNVERTGPGHLTYNTVVPQPVGPLAEGWVLKWDLITLGDNHVPRIIFLPLFYCGSIFTQILLKMYFVLRQLYILCISDPTVP